MLIKMDAYDGRDLQNFRSLLAQFGAQGVTDSRIISLQISKELESRYKTTEIVPQLPNKKAHSGVGVCPSCGGNSLRVVSAFEGLSRLGCEKCMYSVLVK